MVDYPFYEVHGIILLLTTFIYEMRPMGLEESITDIRIVYHNWW